MANVTLDKVHSAINFSVKHMMVSKAKGEFQDFDLEVNGDVKDLENTSVKVTVDVSSIETNNEDRNGHLKSEDFFDVENHPNIVFESKSVKKVSDSEYHVTGDVTIRGTTNEETFTVYQNGIAKDPMGGNMVAGFDVEGKINREDYGLTWNAPLETGGVLIGKEVNLTAAFELVIEE
ncbi:YceI family protein [Aquisalibacillus elongatus]|uniref:Polyisoprenoid-binding protein YceI n=1 Tax=Aquisalibacillus elongatus TaxID=485577 RepID=A0A3N5B3L0_9BACI|nr:YceI family protein [Aquisalibacillus elongatus]RPF52246.1 polyisoprenoid-binding protein YceI [Aquisalibacillus elongatus]